MHSLNEWKDYFQDRGLEEKIINQYLPYIDNFNSKNIPVIFEFEHLSKLVGIKPKYLSRMVNKPSSFYRTYKIPKRKGGFRVIDAPYPSLLSIQKWIYKEILYSLNTNEYAHGFLPDKSIITNAKLHAGKKAFLKLDIKNFFPSIKINKVIGIFKYLGYTHQVSIYLASLCCLKKQLPQGAATSPVISNILCKKLDYDINSLAERYSLTYSRYADDLAISGDYIPCKLIEDISEIISHHKFQVNKDKTYLTTSKNKRILTGISIREKEIKIPRKYKRELKKELHFIIKFGYLSHIERNNIKNPFYLEVLDGRLEFWLSVEPNNSMAIKYKEKLKDIINYMQN